MRQVDGQWTARDECEGLEDLDSFEVSGDLPRFHSVVCEEDIGVAEVRATMKFVCNSRHGLNSRYFFVTG